MKITAVIVAGGKGTRMGADRNKVLLPLLGREALFYTLSAFDSSASVSETVLVAGADDVEECGRVVKRYGLKKVKRIIEGGEERQQSVSNGLSEADGDIVLIHDGARALVTDKEINAVVDDCIRYGAAAAGVKCKNTLKHADDGFIDGTIDRDSVYMIQTPQAFCLNQIREMHRKAAAESFKATDDCMIAERYGVRIKISEGSYDNIKLTTPEDMIIGAEILKKRGYRYENRAGL